MSFSKHYSQSIILLSLCAVAAAGCRATPDFSGIGIGFCDLPVGAVHTSREGQSWIIGCLLCESPAALPVGAQEDLYVLFDSQPEGTIAFDSSHPESLSVTSEETICVWTNSQTELAVTLHATQPGSTTLVATSADGAQIAHFDVSTRPAGGLRLSAFDGDLAAPLQVAPGAKVQLFATLHDEEGAGLYANQSITWRVSDASKAQIDSNGYGNDLADKGAAIAVTALAAGNVTITAEALDFSESVEIMISPDS